MPSPCHLLPCGRLPSRPNPADLGSRVQGLIPKSPEAEFQERGNLVPFVPSPCVSCIFKNLKGFAARTVNDSYWKALTESAKGQDIWFVLDWTQVDWFLEVRLLHRGAA